MNDLVVRAVTICRLLLLLTGGEGVASGNSQIATSSGVSSIGFALIIHADFVQT
jgi:hypothetical protein